MNKIALFVLVAYLTTCSVKDKEKLNTSNLLNDSTEKTNDNNSAKFNQHQAEIARCDSLRLKYSKPIPDSLIENYLEKREVELELYYIAWGCACPNWILLEKKYWCDENSTSYQKYCFYIEPSDTLNKIDPMQVWENGKYLRVKGKFYKEERFPKGFKAWWEYGVIHPAKVLRYTDWEIVEKNNLKAKRKLN